MTYILTFLAGAVCALALTRAPRRSEPHTLDNAQIAKVLGGKL